MFTSFASKNLQVFCLKMWIIQGVGTWSKTQIIITYGDNSKCYNSFGISEYQWIFFATLNIVFSLCPCWCQFVFCFPTLVCSLVCSTECCLQVSQACRGGCIRNMFWASRLQDYLENTSATYSLMPETTDHGLLMLLRFWILDFALVRF